jgi:hypothetical protein
MKEPTKESVRRDIKNYEALDRFDKWCAAFLISLFFILIVFAKWL